MTAVAVPRRGLTHDIAGVLLLAGVYFVAARLSLMTAYTHHTVTALWAPAGISLAALLMGGRRLWPGVFAGAVLSYAGFRADVAIGLAATNTIGAVLGAWLVDHFANGRHAFRRARDVLSWTMWTGLVASAVVATLTVIVLALGGDVIPAEYDDVWIERWLGNLGSVLLLAPALVLWWDRFQLRWRRQQVLEGIAFLASLVIVCGIVFGVPFEVGNSHDSPRAFAFFPILAWSAFRLGPRATATAVAVLAGIAVLATLQGQGPFALADPSQALVLVQAFLSTSAATTLGVAAAVDERQRAQRQVAVLNVELEQRIQERTAALARSEALLAEARQLRERAEAEEERERFLSEASKVLGASLELDATLHGLARLAVPRTADWCAIHLVEAGGIRQVTLAHVDPARVKQVQELMQRFPPRPEQPPAYQRVIDSGQPILIPAISDALLVQSAHSPEQLAFARSLNLVSMMVVPLIARGRTIGALSFATTTASGRHYGDPELSLAMELGRRVAIAVDNTRLFQQTQEAVKAREDFLAIASHELRTPVTSLRLQVQIVERALNEELARARTANDPWLLAAGFQRVLDFIGVLGEDSRRLVRLVNGLLDVTRIATGKLDLHLEELDFRDIVRSGIESVRPEVSNRGVRLTSRLGDPLPGRWDRLRLEQVIANLLSNAVKYGEGRPIVVKAEAEGPDVVLTVQDQGVGVDSAFQARMFDRFEQATHGQQGLGLGLYITKQIVESHGGTISVESRVGEGSTFRVRLPRAPAQTPSPGGTGT